MRGPSLYKYFASLHAVYDALFARGLHALRATVQEAIEQAPPGVDRIRVAPGPRSGGAWTTRRSRN